MHLSILGPVPHLLNQHPTNRAPHSLNPQAAQLFSIPQVQLCCSLRRCISCCRCRKAPINWELPLQAKAKNVPRLPRCPLLPDLYPTPQGLWLPWRVLAIGWSQCETTVLYGGHIDQDPPDLLLHLSPATSWNKHSERREVKSPRSSYPLLHTQTHTHIQETRKEAMPGRELGNTSLAGLGRLPMGAELSLPRPLSC